MIDVPFDETRAVLGISAAAIPLRLHPIDVGFDLRDHDMAVGMSDATDPLLVSYPDERGERRVMQGPREAVLSRLRELGFKFR